MKLSAMTPLALLVAYTLTTQVSSDSYSNAAGGYNSRPSSGYSAPGGYSGSSGGGYNYQPPTSGGYNYSPPSSGGYNYQQPSRAFNYPGETGLGGDSYNRRGGSPSVVYGTPDDNKDSDLILDRNNSSSSSSSKSQSNKKKDKESIRENPSASPTPGKQNDEQKQEAEDDGENGVTREDALNGGGGNVANIQDVRDRLNNEIVNEEVIEERNRFVEGEGENGNGEERFVEGGDGTDGGFTESGSTLTRRRASFKNDRTKNNGRGGISSSISRRVSSTNIDEIISKTRPRSKKGSLRDLTNKAYGIGGDDEESASGSSQRKKLLESSFRKDVQAPSYNNVRDDSESDEDGDGSLAVLGGNFAASNDDKVVSRVSSRKRTFKSRKSYGGLDDDDEDDDDEESDGSRLTSFFKSASSSSSSGKSKGRKSNSAFSGRRNAGDARTSASHTSIRIAKPPRSSRSKRRRPRVRDSEEEEEEQEDQEEEEEPVRRSRSRSKSKNKRRNRGSRRVRSTVPSYSSSRRQSKVHFEHL